VALVAAVLVLLALLFLRPDQRLRELVFGSLGRGPAPLTNGVAGGGLPASRPVGGEGAAATHPPAASSAGSSNGIGNGGGLGGPVAGTGLGNDTNQQNDTFPATGGGWPVASNAPVSGPFGPGASGGGSLDSNTASVASNSTANVTAPPARFAPYPGGRKATEPYVPELVDPANKNPTASLVAEAAKVSSPAAGPTRTPDLLGGNAAARPSRLFDSDAGSNVFFLLDNSTGMRTDGKSLMARAEVTRALEAMDAGKTFYVLFFHSDGFEGMPAPGPVPATPENVRATTNWLFSAGHTAGNDPTQAIRRAFGLVPAPDVVWLLSGGPLPSSVIDTIRVANTEVNAHINTVALYSRAGERVLRQIADENRGVYRFVPPPGEASP
jgi:hypothetical protein